MPTDLTIFNFKLCDIVAIHNSYNIAQLKVENSKEMNTKDVQNVQQI